MNIGTRGSFFAMSIACVTYDACCASVTPVGSPGFVSFPYSVIQTGMFLRPNHLSIDVSNCGSEVSATFGHSTFCVGLPFTGTGYGWWAQASNLRCLFALATPSANVPGRTESVAPALGLLRPFEEVSPIATSAFELPALIPA